jgi:beta-glucosidase
VRRRAADSATEAARGLRALPAQRGFGTAVLLATVCACSGRLAGTEREAARGATDEPSPVARAKALVARMTLDEKIGQLETDAPAIPRLGVVAYDWWSESLHGVARNGVATVFPQAIGLAATFDEDLMGRVGRAIADEARTKFEAARGQARGSARYRGLTFFAPNINIFRDPRWGRGQETYGEDPFLTGRLAVAYVRGLQGATPGDPTAALHVAAVVKHFAVHSGPELDRHRFNAVVDAHDLADTYLPQFAAVVREAAPSGIMAAYNRVNGVPAVANAALLDGWLRGQLGFDGFVVGDCGAVGDVVWGHRAAADEAHAAALALRAGTDLDCGSSFRHLREAAAAGLVTEAEIDRAVIRLFAVRFRLGLFDAAPPPRPAEAFPPPAHRALAREAARKSLVLLRNDGTLPISPAVRHIAIVGPLAEDANALLGNYHGQAVAPVTPAAGLRAAALARGVKVEVARGVTLAGPSRAEFGEALKVARRAELIIAVLGLSPRLEGEEGDADSANPAGDRRDLNLPGLQESFLKALLALGKPTVVVLSGGGALALPSAPRPANAVLMTWYAGEEAGNAIADVLFGEASPSGRLPVTFYRSAGELPPFNDYKMTGRTYRYFAGTPAYPFGAGLGYAPIAYRDLSAIPAPAGAAVQVTVSNQGTLSADEVVEVYLSPHPRSPTDPLRSLAAFQRVSLGPHETRTVQLNIPAAALIRVNSTGTRVTLLGPWDITVASQTTSLTLTPPVSSTASPPDASAPD